MFGQRRSSGTRAGGRLTAALVCALVGAEAGRAVAREAAERHPASSPSRGSSSARPAHEEPRPTPLQDDATLHDVQLLGPRTGWACGDRGVVWTTIDGGRAWRFVPTPLDAPLRSICFLTDALGWVVGGATRPYTQTGYGVILFTRDGGRHWKRLGPPEMPRLCYVRFFSPQNGVVVGEGTPENPTGVYGTTDGGKTWQPLPGPGPQDWRTAAFTHEKTAVLAGMRGTVSIVGGGRLLRPRVGDLGLRTVRGAALPQPGRTEKLETLDRSPDSIGWLVGDGALVLRTVDGGVVWTPPPTALPRELTDIADFRGVAGHGERVWVAGAPGSVVWHSADAGRTWRPQRTGETAPLEDVAFASDRFGVAVGAMGIILRTEDGGQTWHAVRGAGRRAAILTLHARPKHVSFRLLARYAADDGYRTAVLLPVRRDIGPEGAETRDIDLRLNEAVVATGGTAGEIDWRFPVTLPGLDRDADKLAADWSRRTEGRLPQAFLGKLVAQLRTWRPNVVVLDAPAPDDAAAAMLADAVRKAVTQAADPTRYIAHAELAQLPPWRVDRVLMRLPAGSAGETAIEAFDVLPHLGKLVETIAKAGASRLGDWNHDGSIEAYQLVRESPGAALEKPRDANSDRGPGHRSLTDFFAGIVLAPGSAARRELPSLSERVRERQRTLAQRQRNLAAYAERFLDEPRQAAQLIAHLGEAARGLTDEQAALQLARLAEQYRKRAQWDLAAETLVELVDKYPDQPPAVEAMRWLFQLWNSTETAWQRARRMQVEQRRLVSDPEAMADRVRRMVDRERIGEGTGGRQTDGAHERIRDSRRAMRDAPLTERPSRNPPDRPADDPLRFVRKAGRLDVGTGEDWRSGVVRHWSNQALDMAVLLRQRAPAVYRTPEVQFPLASLLRRRGALRPADAIHRRLDRGAAASAWSRTASAELWLLQPQALPPKKFASCRRTSKRPHLDGLLSEACWANAEELRLSAPGEEAPGRAAGNDGSASPAIVFLAYDTGYLYLAASIPRAAGGRGDRPQLAGRTHDADLRGFDRLSVSLDVDRDYATYYTLEVDQRGWTRDACWNDRTWNPRWFVAADADDRRWRIEAAIPWEELVPRPPQPNDIWAIGLVRTVPALRVESWTHPAGQRPRPESFGLLRFSE